jgi:hypothetical protein
METRHTYCPRSRTSCPPSPTTGYDRHTTTSSNDQEQQTEEDPTPTARRHRVIEHDVVVAGAGPTGLMLAGELAAAGADVLVIECRSHHDLVGSRAGGAQMTTYRSSLKLRCAIAAASVMRTGRRRGDPRISAAHRNRHTAPAPPRPPRRCRHRRHGQVSVTVTGMLADPRVAQLGNQTPQ